MSNKLKAYISILLVFTVLLSLGMTDFFAVSTDNNLKMGDVNLDNRVDISDVTAIQKYASKITNFNSTQLLLADVDGDKRIDIHDATYLQHYIVGDEGYIMPEVPTYTQPTSTEPTTQSTTQPTTAKPVISNNITVRFSNNKNWQNVYAYMWNSKTNLKNSWPGTKLNVETTNLFGEKIYKIDVDLTKYDRVIFNNNSGSQTIDIPLSKSSSAYFVDKSVGSGKFAVGTYAYGANDEGKITTTTLTYDEKIASTKTKKITVWTPPGYDAQDKSKKYGVLYMTDGQNIFGDIANDPHCSENEWEADENVLSLMANGADGVIVVGIDDATANRDSELTPDIGAVVPQWANDFKVRTGEYYSNFVVNTVMPYVNSHFNVSNSKELTGIMGSSSGGIEAFYIGMEHMDKFGYVGALSPAFLLFSESTWESYLSKFDFSNKNNLPKIYFYTGNYNDGLENDISPYTIKMPEWLVKKGYPQDKLMLDVDEGAKHNELYWRIYFQPALAFGLDY